MHRDVYSRDRYRKMGTVCIVGIGMGRGVYILVFIVGIGMGGRVCIGMCIVGIGMGGRVCIVAIGMGGGVYREEIRQWGLVCVSNGMVCGCAAVWCLDVGVWCVHACVCTGACFFFFLSGWVGV